MKKRIYTALAVFIMLGSAIGLFLVMTSIFDLVGKDMSLEQDHEIAETLSY